MSDKDPVLPLVLELTPIHRYLLQTCWEGMVPGLMGDEQWRASRIKKRTAFTQEEADACGIIHTETRGRMVLTGIKGGKKYDEAQTATKSIKLASQEELSFLRDRLPSAAIGGPLLEDFLELREMFDATPDAPDICEELAAEKKAEKTDEEGGQ